MADNEDNYIANLAKNKSLAPIGDKVLVHPKDLSKKTDGGIIIPDSAKRHALIGTVLAAGPGRYSEGGTLIPMTVKSGQDVIFNRYSGVNVKIDESTVLLMSIDDIQGIITDAEQAPKEAA